MPFFDIFSSNGVKKQKEDEFSQIIVDDREKNSLVASELVKLGRKIEFSHLPVADYIINDVAIERKTLSDLYSSIIDKRIFHQLDEIRQYPKFLLLLEKRSRLSDPVTDRVHDINYNVIRGFILSTLLNKNIPCIFSEDELDSALYISILSKKKEKSGFSIRPQKIALSKKEQVQFILEGFPSVGPSTAKKLIERFGSLKNIINAPTEELDKILKNKSGLFKALLDFYP